MRRKLDQYYTPTLAVNQMLQSLEFGLFGTVLEPCNGKGAISNELRSKGLEVITNDVDKNNRADYQLDLSVPLNWALITEPIDFVITNPPFNLAPEIIPYCHKKAINGVIALLRLTFLEPCFNRVNFLQQYPPNQIIVTPRISFTGKGTDNVTTSWFIWLKDKNLKAKITQPVQVLNNRGQSTIAWSKESFFAILDVIRF